MLQQELLPDDYTLVDLVYIFQLAPKVCLTIYLLLTAFQLRTMRTTQRNVCL